MKNKQIFTLLLVMAFLFITGQSFAQSPCSGFETCSSLNYKHFHESGYSRSGQFNNGTTSVFRVTVFSGLDYHFAMCYEKELGEVQLKIMVDNNEKTVLYDNLLDNYEKEIVISMVTSQTLLVEVSAPGDLNEIKADSPKYCLGLLVEYRTTPKSGF